MRSRASIKRHPVHPALIPFPLAFLYGALIFDVLGVFTHDASFWATGRYLAIAGVAAGVIAAVPGFIDYVYTVPPHSSGKKRATRHMLVMLGAMGVVALGLLLRAGTVGAPGMEILALEAVAAVLLTVGGWMGGTLVGRNMISVDHRHAEAGKWKEETIAAEGSGRVRVASADELKVDQMKLLRIDGKRIVVARSESGWVAFDDRCTHRGGSLADGVMICGTVQCLWHGSQFDCGTGAVKAGPAEKPIATYAVEEADGAVYLRLPVPLTVDVPAE